MIGGVVLNSSWWWGEFCRFGGFVTLTQGHQYGYQNIFPCAYVNHVRCEGNSFKDFPRKLKNYMDRKFGIVLSFNGFLVSTQGKCLWMMVSIDVPVGHCIFKNIFATFDCHLAAVVDRALNRELLDWQPINRCTTKVSVTGTTQGDSFHITYYNVQIKEDSMSMACHETTVPPVP